jgi:hypothetical protein
VRFGGETRRISGVQADDLWHLVAEQPLTGAMRLRVAVDQDRVSIASAGLPGGSRGPFSGTLRRAEAGIGREWESGLRIEGAFVTSGSQQGGAATISLPDARGATIVQAELHRAYWDLPEAAAGDGVRDRVELRREMRVGERVSARAGADWNRYSVQGAPGAARTLGATAGVSVRVWDRPHVTLNYVFDAEHRLGVSPGNAALPLANREVHSASIGVSQHLTRAMEIDGAAGYAADRLGGTAPFFSLNWRYLPRGCFGAQALYDRRLYLLGTARTVSTFGAGIFMRY